ncbi:leucine-rich repeat domain-containing protein [Candidatus Dependentiae bacterium]|nr:leucine-rich repeat domain-containing protein [Candidatus Dependentiae bacterium]
MNRSCRLATIFFLITTMIQQADAFDIQSGQKVQSTIQLINNNPPPALLLNFRNWLKTPEEGTRVLQTLLNGINDTAKQQITEIIIENARFGALPDLARFHNLQKLEIMGNNLANINLQLKLPASLKELHLANNGLTQPPSISGADNVETLNLVFNALHKIPNLASSHSLKELNLSNNQISTLPSLAHLRQLKVLKLANNQLSIPPDLSGLTDLIEVFLSNNQLTTPPILGGLNSLRTIGLSDNRLTAPPVVINLPELRNLYLQNNHITTPPELSDSNALLSFLDLRNNPIENPLQVPSVLGRRLRIIGVPSNLINYSAIHDLVELNTLIAQIVSAIYTTEAVPEGLIQTIINQAQPELNSPNGITRERVQALINQEVERRRQESVRQHLATLSEQQEQPFSPEDRIPVEIITNPEHTHPIFFAQRSFESLGEGIGRLNISLQPAKVGDSTLTQQTRALLDAWSHWKQKDASALRKFIQALKGIDIISQESFILSRAQTEEFMRDIGISDSRIAIFMSDHTGQEYIDAHEVAEFLEKAGNL